jgi:glycosyltransferase involved in cell wall biosynthesis
VKILLVNWNDRQNPQAGGAEIHVHELFGRIASWGHDVDFITSGWPGAASATTVDGMHVRRVGGRHSFAVQGRGAVARALHEKSYDVVVEDVNKLPLFLPSLTRLPFVAIVPHLFGTTAFAEASWPVAATVWAAELPIPWLYRRAGFHAISESTRDDLVRRGVRPDRIVVIHPGVDSTWYCPDPDTPRAAHPTFLYLGRLKRYKGVEYALRALAAARQVRSDVTLDICGPIVCWRWRTIPLWLRGWARPRVSSRRGYRGMPPHAPRWLILNAPLENEETERHARYHYRPSC